MAVTRASQSKKTANVQRKEPAAQECRSEKKLKPVESSFYRKLEQLFKKSKGIKKESADFRGKRELKNLEI